MHVNFGQEPFVYGPGAALRAATDVSMYYETQDLVSVFEELPFFYSEIDGEKQQSSVTTEEAQLEAEEQEEQEAAAAEEEERETQPQPDQTKTPEPRLQDGSQGLLIPDVSTSSIHQGASESVKTRWDAVTAGAGHQDQGSNKTGAKADAWDGESLEMTTPSSTVVQSPASHRLVSVVLRLLSGLCNPGCILVALPRIHTGSFSSRTHTKDVPGTHARDTYPGHLPGTHTQDTYPGHVL